MEANPILTLIHAAVRLLVRPTTTSLSLQTNDKGSAPQNHTSKLISRVHDSPNHTLVNKREPRLRHHLSTYSSVNQPCASGVATKKE